MLLKSINPNSGEVVREYPEYQWEEIDNIIRSVDASFKTWKNTKLEYRIEKIKALQTYSILKKRV